MEQYRRDPKLAARVLADASYQFGYDCIIIDFDTCSLAEAMGASLSFPVDAPAHVSMPPLQSLSQIRDLPIPDPHRDGRLPLWLETTRELRKIVGNDKAIMGRADQGPFGLLFQLRGHENMMMDVLDSPEEEMMEALEICAQAGARFARAQMEAGADLTSIGDSAAGESLISPTHFNLYGGPFQKRYRELLGDGCLSLHICGKTNSIIEGMVQSGCEVLELDHWNDMERSLSIIDQRSCVFGNLDPSSVLSQGTKQRVLDVSRKVLEYAKAKTWKFVLCPGCLANADVPAENILAMTEAAAQWGVYETPPKI
jgi:uroporphyrinogen decarboxylase